MRAATVAAVVALLATATGACGGGSRRSSSTTTTFALPPLPSTSSPPTSSRAHGPATTSPQAAAACGGAPDSTAAVNALVARTRDGSTVTFPAGACYRVDGTVEIVGRHNLTIDGNGATFSRARATAGAFSPQWLVQLSSGIKITGVHITGPKPGNAGYDPDHEGQPGVAIDNSTDVTVQDAVVENVWGDFFRISNRTDRVVITGNALTEAGRQGLAVVGGSHITFDGNVVTRVRRFAVDLEPYPSTPVRFVTITNNRFFDPSIGFVCATGYDNRCDRGAALSNVTVANNIQEG